MNPDLRIINKIKGIEKKSKKHPVFLNLDADVLAWFKSTGKGYQTFINEVLRAYKEAVISDLKPTQTEFSRFEFAQACFNEFYAQCFWHLKKDLIVTEREIPLIIEGLRKYGGREGFQKAHLLCQ